MPCKNCNIAYGVDPTIPVEIAPSVSYQYIEQPRCMFDENGVFTKDNWQCGTSRRLRTFIDNTLKNGNRYKIDYVVSDQQTLATLSLEDGDFILLGWYKNRGRTELGLYVSESKYRPLTFEDVERFPAPFRG